MITPASTADAVYRLSSKPPDSRGLSRRSPTVAPSGRVSTNAAQNSAVRDSFVK